ncbi:hypothetical protein KKH15_02900 [Patescibacteria group bacterium]|nr:hypothetical protein [Patescibacteria group bacterium]MBU1755197.1 hypothetical protein [Patescibacteria group bacterium]
MKLTTMFSSVAVLALIAVVAVSPLLVSANETEEKPSRNGTSMTIGADGGVLVRGAEVTGVSGDTVTARTQWGDTSVTWTIETNASTKFMDLSGKEGTLADVDTGETVSFSGHVAAGTAFTVDADVLRNWSEGERYDNRSVNAEVRAELKDKAEGFWKSLGARVFTGFKWGENK